VRGTAGILGTERGEEELLLVAVGAASVRVMVEMVD
jgi:hypothetical protein